jgi:signal transduction histidine kinase
MERRLSTEYSGRVATMAALAEADLARQSSAIAARLRALTSDLVSDNRFRFAVRGDQTSRRYLLDYAGQAMRLSGLSLLQVQDSSGRILSSGHFRNEFDRLQPELPQFLRVPGRQLSLVRTRTPEAPIVALVRLDSARVGGVMVNLVGGIEAALSSSAPRGEDLTVTLAYPGAGPPVRGANVIREIPIPYLDLVSDAAPAADTARLVITQSRGTLEALQRGVGVWVLVALGLTVTVAVVGAAWLSARISRPLRELADKTAAIDLDRLDQSFESDRQDEIGALSRLLGAMTDRLRNSSSRLREAERRAAVGELARQVNHDVKNGLGPIRNVLRHFAQVAKQDPAGLAAVFEARRGTLESSVEYLDNLARNYDRLSPSPERRPCDVNRIVQQVLRNTTGNGSQLRAQLGEGLPSALGDGLMIRRILENVVGNAMDSIAGMTDGQVTVTTERTTSAGSPAGVRIIVADTGRGMTREELDRAFDDFYTTKPGGTGLGLSIVRRLMLDLNGTLRIETEAGAGTRVVVELPALAEENRPA